jgi:DNA polymerase-4
MHLDLDCFFVSAHRTVDKSLLNRPVAVGGRNHVDMFTTDKQKRRLAKQGNTQEYFKDENGRIRGIISTSSYEARACGVKTAMSVNEALRLCPQLHMVPAHFPLYHELSYKLLQLLEKHTPLVEQASIDEFFVDVSGWVKDEEAFAFGQKLQKIIKEQLDLPISIGIAKSKYLAKLATNYAKPIGVRIVHEHEVSAFIKDIPIGKFPGIGKRYQEKLKGYGIHTLGQIQAKKQLFYSWNKSDKQLYNRVCGIGDFKLKKRVESKSIGIGRSFDPLHDRAEIKRRMMILARYLCFLILKKQLNPQTFLVHIKYEFNLSSKMTMNTNRMFNERYFKDCVLDLYEKMDTHPTHSIIQLNISVNNFIEQRMDSFNLFTYNEDVKNKELNKHIQKLREKFGVDIIKNASEL